jgi:PAS domain S-box-containing protein
MQNAGAPDAEFLRLIFESAKDFAIFSMDRFGRATSWNQGAERVLGFTAEEILGESVDVIFPPEEGGAKAAEEERATALRDGRAEDERWQRRKDGTRFWASGLLMPLAVPGAGFVKILRDRTDAHQWEARLRENEERFRILATSIPQLVFRTRSDGYRTWPSPQWIAFTGLDVEASLGLGWLDAIHPDDRRRTLDAWSEARLTGEYYCEHRVLKTTGEYRWHQTRATPVGDSDADWVGTMTDVHDMRALRDRQDVLLAELQHRTRNLLAVVQAIANQTQRTSESCARWGEYSPCWLEPIAGTSTLGNLSKARSS